MELIAITKINATKKFNAQMKNYANQQCYSSTQTCQIELDLINEQAFACQLPENMNKTKFVELVKK